MNALLHREVFGSSGVLEVFDVTSSSHVAKLGSDVQNCFAGTHGQILLGTAIVGICHRGQIFRTRALIVSSSHSNFISEKLQKKLGLLTVRMNVKVSGLNGASTGTVQK